MLSVDAIYNDIVSNIEKNAPISLRRPQRNTFVQKVAGEDFDKVLTEQIVNGRSDYSHLTSVELMDRIDKAVTDAAQKYNMDTDLIKAVIKAESSFNPDSTSSSGAQGLMQLMPGTAASLGVVDAYNIEQNIDGGTRYLKQMIERFDGDISLALAAYNAGPGNVTKYDGIPPFEETQNYVPRVLSYMTRFKLGMDN